MEHVQTQWANYERKLTSKREMLTTYANQLKDLEKEHLGCIERQMKDRKEIDALTRVVTVETQKHWEKQELAQQLEYQKNALEKEVTELQHQLSRI